VEYMVVIELRRLGRIFSPQGLGFNIRSSVTSLDQAAHYHIVGL
jgi:hypothetical protein